MEIANPISGKKLCVGDIEHNEFCKLLKEACPKKYQKKVFFIIEKECERLDFRWIHMLFSKTEVKKLCALLNSKSETTFNKRIKSFEDYLMRSAFNIILNGDKLKIIQEIGKNFKWQD